MKRITVSITLADGYYGSSLKKVSTAMINAAVLRATDLDLEIRGIEAKIGHTRKPS